MINTYAPTSFQRSHILGMDRMSEERAQVFVYVIIKLKYFYNKNNIDITIKLFIMRIAKNATICHYLL